MNGTKRVHSFAQTLFKPFRDKQPKRGWKAATSISTDGVSISIIYERTIETEVHPKKKTTTPFKNDGNPPCDDYDAFASTIVDNKLVLGVDPGRTTIVTVVCVDDQGKKHSWKVSRGQFYTEGLYSDKINFNRRDIAVYFRSLVL